jgi:hypothetical protein
MIIISIFMHFFVLLWSLLHATIHLRRDPLPPAPACEECEQVMPRDEDEEDVRHEDEEEQHGDEGEEEEEEAAGGGSATSGGSGIYLRGPTSLPQRLIPPHRQPLIRPDGEK